MVQYNKNRGKGKGNPAPVTPAKIVQAPTTPITKKDAAPMPTQKEKQELLPLALRRAKHALEQINGLDRNNCGNYVSYAKSLPAEILQMGLGQAMATLLAAAKGKEQDAHRLLYNHLEAWLCGTAAYRDSDAPYPVGNLMTSITSHRESEYLHAQAEALAYLEWLKKFAVAFLPDRGGD